MKKIILLFLQITLSTSLFSAPKADYNTVLWAQIETCLTNRTPETAQAPIAQLKLILAKDKITDQSAKLLIYRMMFAQMNEEKSLPDFIKEMESELNTSWVPYSNLLHSMLAESYLNYFRQNRYSFYNRKTQAGSEAQDIENLTEVQIFEKISKHIQLSLANTEKLSQTPINQWSEIIEKGTKPSIYRDNLYDFLVWRGVDLYKQCNGLNSRPTNSFNPTERNYFGNSQEFAKLNITSEDSLNNNYLALRLIQEVTQKYLNATNLEKEVDIDLLRLQYLYETLQNTDSLYINALTELDATTKNLQINSFVKYKTAQYYSQIETTESIKKALELCKLGYKNAPKSEGGINCKTLENQLTYKELSTQVEEIYPSSYNIIGRISYKNITLVYARIYKLTNSTQIHYYEADSVIKRGKLVREFEISTDAPQDNLPHFKEFSTDSFSIGDYALITSAKKEFTNKQNILDVIKFTVSNLSVLSELVSNTRQLLVLNRVTGKAIANATYQITAYNDNYFRGKRDLFKGKSNEKGEIFIGKSLKQAKSYKYTINVGNDVYAEERPYFYYNSEPQTISHREDYILTDRKIYRPNQPIYFKVISFISDNTTASAKVGELQTISLHDMNGKIIASQTVTTNKYGSASGTFNIPSAVLNGDWTITSNEGRSTFQVEEYVRPKFEITFLPITEMYLEGDTATIVGQATSYTQIQLQNCTVKYKISISEGSMPLYKNGRYIPYNSNDYTLIINSIKTDNEGKFTIKIPIPKTKNLSQSFDISADVTSSTGETISGKTTLNINKNLASISINSESTYELNNGNNNLVISKINSNGATVELPVSYTIYSLNCDLPLVPQKLWDDEEPIYANQKSEDLKQMPIIDDRANLSKLPIKELISKGSLKSTENEITNSVFKLLKTGIYRIVFTADVSRGEPITQSAEFTIIDSKSNKLEIPAFLNFTTTRTDYKGGDTIKFTVGSTLKNADIYYQLLWSNMQAIDKKWTANNSKTNIEIPIPLEYFGNIIIEAFTVNGNRIYHQTRSLNVTSRKSELNLKLITFRDKIAPNTKENWKIEVKDYENKSPNSELLLTMYDASLDAFIPNHYNTFYNLFSQPYISSSLQFNDPNLSYGNNSNTINITGYYKQLTYPSLNWYNFFQNNYNRREAVYCMAMSDDAVKEVNSPAIQPMGKASAGTRNSIKFTTPIILADNAVAEEEVIATKKEKPSSEPTIRKNLQETAFFLPHITTDSAGVASFTFTVPEALTTWKILGFAHTIDGKSGSLEYKTTTQKDLMVAPNMPRFLYQNDRLLFKASISRLSGKIDKGKITLTLTDEDGKSLNSLIEGSAMQEFEFGTNSSISTSWWINVKDTKNGIFVKTVAESENYSDGEQRFLPIIPNKTRVVESLPFYDIDKGDRTLTFNKLKDNCTTTENRKLTINYTQNSSWEVVKALPYLLEGSDENSDELFNRYYANTLTTNILQHNSNISSTIEKWSHATTGNEFALIGNLEAKQVANSVLLDQTPWLNDGKNETEARKRLVTLLNESKVSSDQSNTLSKLLANQMASGAWPWFKGMEASFSISQYITEGLIQMTNDSIDPKLYEEQYWSMIVSGVNYCDNTMIEEYNRQIKQKITPSPSLTDIEYLATRQLAPSIKKPKDLGEIEQKYQATVKTHWTDYSTENQALIAQWLYRSGDKTLANKIMESLFQCAIKSPEMGNYYKRESNYGYFRNDIEKHSNILKAFAEIGGYNYHVKLMQLYLIQQKRTNHWQSNKATTQAISALILGHEKLLTPPAKSDKLFVGKNEVVPDATESGTGYFAKSWMGSEITSDLADIKIEKNSNTPSWGSMSWEYFTEVDKIEANNQNPLTVNREYFKINETLRGIDYEAITPKTLLKIGDKIMVRLTVKTDRPMEYVYLKDNRPASAEPIEIFSGYNYNGGVGFYQNMKDASSNFYIHYMPKGLWKVEYTTRVSQIGEFTSGICTVQCYYAPEFQNQTRGEKIETKE